MAIGASLDAINPHREKQAGTFTPWTAALLWFIVFLFALFLFGYAANHR